MASHSGSKIVIYAALAGNFLIAITKFVAAGFTGSSAMLSEGVHSLVDTSNELLLLYGLRQAAAPPTKTRPFGHGRELYFWSFIVALLIFALGAGVSFYQGIIHILHPEHIKDALINYIVLGFCILFEGFTWIVALRSFNKSRGKLGFFQAIHRSKDPSVFSVLFEDSAALLGLFVALIGISLAIYTNNPIFDGIASLIIGAILAITAIFLARECKGLLIGEPALPEVEKAIIAHIEADKNVQSVNGLITVQLGPEQIIANVSLEFDDHLTTTEIEQCLLRIEKDLKKAAPDLVGFFIKPQTAKTWQKRRKKIKPAS